MLLAIGALAVAPRLHTQASPSCPPRPATLKAMRDCFRPVLVFAPAATDAAFEAQQALLEQYADDMMDRNLLYVPILAQPAHFQQPLDAPYVVPEAAELKTMRERFHVDPADFVVVLVGKDGGEKFRSHKPVSVLKLDELVDAMPMGRQEKAVRSAESH
jgi:hypothetical protein